MWPDDESIIHIIEPAEGLMSSPVEHHLLKVLDEEVCLFVDLASKVEVQGGQDMSEEPQDILLKMLT
jgi:hypothetical protein